MANEKRLIDANALTKQMCRACNNECCEEPCEPGECFIYDAVANATAVDAVEVVRCKDCRWARTQDHREPACTPAEALICQCFMHHHIPAPWGARLAVNPNDFCSYGERSPNVKA